MDWINRFWSWVDIRRFDDCWEWQGGTTEGYGMFCTGEGMVLAHRLSWIIENGQISDGLCVLHQCDNRKCVNPNHLFLGTKKDNTNDARRKGRIACRSVRKPSKNSYNSGTSNGRAKLTEEDVVKIRELYASGQYTVIGLAKQYGVAH